MANFKLEMKHISSGTTFEIGKRYISNVSSISQCQNDSGKLSYDVISNTGYAEIFDEKDIIKKFLLDRVVDASVDRFRVKMFINDKCVQEHYSSDSDYDSSNSKLTLSLTGKMDLIRHKKYTDGNFFAVAEDGVSLKSFFIKILQDIGCSDENINNILSKKYLYYSKNLVTLDAVLSKTKSNAIYVDEENYADILKNICEVAQINLFYNDDGEIDFTSSRPAISTDLSKNSIFIPQKDIYTDLTYSVINHNSIAGVEIPTVSAGIDTFPLNGDDIYFTKTRQVSISYSDGNLVVGSSYLDNYEFEFLKSSSGDCGYMLCKFTSKFNQLDDKYKLFNVSSEPYYSVTYDSVDYTNFVAASYSTTTKGEQMYNVFSTYDDFKTYVQNIANNVTFSTAKMWQNVEPIIVGMIDDGESGSYGFSSNGGKATYVFASFGTFDNEGSSVVGMNRVKRPVTNITISFGASAEMYYINDSDTSYYGDEDNYYSFDKNTLITDTTRCSLFQKETSSSSLIVTYESMYTKDIIAENILSDYEYDVITGTIEICCDDFNDMRNNKVIDFNNGQLLQAGQVIYIPNSAYKNRISGYWGITSREFDYDGGPTVKLNVINLKLISTGSSIII